MQPHHDSYCAIASISLSLIYSNACQLKPRLRLRILSFRSLIPYVYQSMDCHYDKSVFAAVSKILTSQADIKR